MPAEQNPVAYFCAEFGIDSNLPTYAGGLGILAGDTLLESAHQDFPMIGIGLLYQGRRFLQEFSPDGLQVEDASPFQAENTSIVKPVEHKGKRLFLNISFHGEELKIISYQQRLGTRTNLYLLSTDCDGNSERWRDIMQAEYCCGDETQLMQQLVLGIGGVRLLRALNVVPSFYHFQEGRPIFAHWEIARQIMNYEKIDYQSASQKAKSKIIYTNHTLVPDGNLVYNLDLVRSYAADYASQNNISSVDDLISPGINKDNAFSITLYGLNISRTTSAVSKLHGDFCKKTWPDYNWKVVTNGIHLPRWQSYEFTDSRLTDYKLWDLHLSKKRDLARVVKKRSGFTYDPERLVLGWARRISGYKQVQKIFEDSQRLGRILRTEGRPVQILVAGKAHPGDSIGKKCIQDVMKIMTNELSDHALFIPNYDIALASNLIMGVDVWLNTPEYGKEACGTSGMKALANGVLNCSIADGWVAEADLTSCGWIHDHKKIPTHLYDLLENEIIPLFYDRNENQLPEGWIKKMRSSISLSSQFSTDRMLREYTSLLYK